MTKDPRVEWLFDITEKTLQFMRAQGTPEELIPLVFGAGFAAYLLDFPPEMRAKFVAMHIEHLHAVLTEEGS